MLFHISERVCGGGRRFFSSREDRKFPAIQVRPQTWWGLSMGQRWEGAEGRPLPGVPSTSCLQDGFKGSHHPLLEALSSDFLACKICLEQLQVPKRCPACTPTARVPGTAGQGRPPPCPECRESVPAPTGVAAFKTNFFVNGLLDLVKARARWRPAGRGSRPVLCPLMKPVRGPATRCLDCADDLCQACGGSVHRADPQPSGGGPGGL